MRRGTGSFCALNRPTRNLTKKRRESFWKVWSQGRFVKSRIKLWGRIASCRPIFKRPFAVCATSQVGRFKIGLQDAMLPHVVLLLLLTAAFRQDMHDQPRYQPADRSPFFENGP